MLGILGIWEWWARQGLNLRPHPCEGLFKPRNGHFPLLDYGTERD